MLWASGLIPLLFQTSVLGPSRFPALNWQLARAPLCNHLSLVTWRTISLLHGGNKSQVVVLERCSDCGLSFKTHVRQGSGDHCREEISLFYSAGLGNRVLNKWPLEGSTVQATVNQSPHFYSCFNIMTEYHCVCFSSPVIASGKTHQ